MKKKHIVILLLVIGVVLLCVSIVFALIATANKNIIGGADWPTFLFVFSYEKRGLYSTLAFLGIVAIVASIVVGIAKRGINYEKEDNKSGSHFACVYDCFATDLEFDRLCNLACRQPNNGYFFW